MGMREEVDEMMETQPLEILSHFFLPLITEVRSEAKIHPVLDYLRYSDRHWGKER